jgi:hypothetical protein
MPFGGGKIIAIVGFDLSVGEALRGDVDVGYLEINSWHEANARDTRYLLKRFRVFPCIICEWGISAIVGGQLACRVKEIDHLLLAIISNLAMSKFRAPFAVVPYLLRKNLASHGLHSLLGEQREGFRYCHWRNGHL